MLRLFCKIFVVLEDENVSKLIIIFILFIILHVLPIFSVNLCVNEVILNNKEK